MADGPYAPGSKLLSNKASVSLFGLDGSARSKKSAILQEARERIGAFAGMGTGVRSKKRTSRDHREPYILPFRSFGFIACRPIENRPQDKILPHKLMQ